MSEDPRAAYESRLRARRAAAEGLARRAASLSNARLAVFAAGAVVAFAAYGFQQLSPAWLLPRQLPWRLP